MKLANDFRKTRNIAEKDGVDMYTTENYEASSAYLEDASIAEEIDYKEINERR